MGSAAYGALHAARRLGHAFWRARHPHCRACRHRAAGRFQRAALALRPPAAQEAALRPCRTGAAGPFARRISAESPPLLSAARRNGAPSFSRTTPRPRFINFVEHAGGGIETLGYLTAFLTALEVPTMLFFAHFPPEELHRRAAVFVYLLLKTAAIAAAPNIRCSFAAESLQVLFLCAVRARDRLCHASSSLRRRC